MFGIHKLSELRVGITICWKPFALSNLDPNPAANSSSANTVSTFSKTSVPTSFTLHPQFCSLTAPTIPPSLFSSPCTVTNLLARNLAALLLHQSETAPSALSASKNTQLARGLHEIPVQLHFVPRIQPQVCERL